MLGRSLWRKSIPFSHAVQGASTDYKVLRFQSTIGSEVAAGCRDLFVVDHSWSLKKWADKMTTPAQYNITDSNKNLKHPGSGHIVSKYAIYQFENSAFHFNDVGEYYLNITAAHSFSPSFIDHEESEEDKIKDVNGTHSVVIWPDSILVRNASANDVEAITDLVMTQKMKLSEVQVKEFLADRSESETIISKVTNVVAVVSCGNEEYLETDGKLQELRATSDDMLASYPSSNIPKPAFLMAADMRGHRNASKVMILSVNDERGEVADCFGEWEGDRAGATLQSHLVYFVSK